MEVGELVAVETEKVQEGDVEVTNVVDFFDGLAAEVVRDADGLAGFDGNGSGFSEARQKARATGGHGFARMKAGKEVEREVESWLALTFLNFLGGA